MELLTAAGPALAAFAEEVGADDPVTVVGGRTQWDVGGVVDAGARPVSAPAGVVAYDPAEMVVRCGAGTTLADLEGVLAGGGQTTALPDWPAATVGGVLAVGRSGIRRLGRGPVRDAVLEVRAVSAEGRLVKAGAAVVKNVTGYDLCRLLVGSLGTLAFIGEVVLRCIPRPRQSRWLAATGVDPFDVRRRLVRPASILWDGSTTWVLLEGGAGDVAGEARALPVGFSEVEGPPPVPASGRLSLRPGELRRVPDRHDRFVAEVGVGTVHLPVPVEPAAPRPDTVDLHRRLKAAFDPRGRLNPGRTVVGP